MCTALLRKIMSRYGATGTRLLRHGARTAISIHAHGAVSCP